jgi:23S rRNA (uracil1939-C5)-methyltransferase
VIELRPSDIAHGGEAVARVDGKAHFVAGAMPGELVTGEIVRDKKRWARVELAAVVEPSPDRVPPPCPYFGECGGCQWQYAAYPAQLDWKQRIVAGQLQHLGGVTDPPVRETVATANPYGYRNRMDFAVGFGTIGLRRRKSRDLVAVDRCLLMHPTIAEVYERVDGLDDARGLTLRAGIATGETLAVVKGEVPDGIGAWGCSVSQRTDDGLQPIIGDGFVHEEVGGVTFRVTGDAFFQNNTPGAASLVGLVSEALEPGGDDLVLDGYAGGGLFGITLGLNAREVIGVESNLLSVADFAHNATRAGVDHRLFNTDFAAGLSLIKDPWHLAVVDPPRDGLGAEAVGGVTACRPRAIAYVSCDPASLARDTRLFAEAGYTMEWAAPVDLFPQTFHVETVAKFVPA